LQKLMKLALLGKRNTPSACAQMGFELGERVTIRVTTLVKVITSHSERGFGCPKIYQQNL